MGFNPAASICIDELVVGQEQEQAWSSYVDLLHTNYCMETVTYKVNSLKLMHGEK